MSACKYDPGVMIWGTTLRTLFWKRAQARRVVAVSSLLGLACTTLDNPRDTCLDLGICTEPAGGSPSDEVLPEEWACLDQDIEIEAPQATAATAFYRTAVLDFTNPTAPLPEVTVLACPANDYTCEGPIAQGSAFPEYFPLVPTAGYQIEVPVRPLPFTGYFKFVADGYREANVVRFLVNDFNSPSPVQLVRNEKVAEFATDLQVSNPQDLIDTGIFAAGLFNCNNEPGAGGLLVMEPESDGLLSWGIVDGLPVRDARSRAGALEAGIAGLALLEDGAYTFCGEVAGRRFGGVTARIRGGRLTSTTMSALQTCPY